MIRHLSRASREAIKLSSCVRQEQPGLIERLTGQGNPFDMGHLDSPRFLDGLTHQTGKLGPGAAVYAEVRSLVETSSQVLQSRRQTMLNRCFRGGQLAHGTGRRLE